MTRDEVIKMFEVALSTMKKSDEVADDYIIISKRDMNKIHGALSVGIEAMEKEVAELTGNIAVLKKALKVVENQ